MTAKESTPVQVGAAAVPYGHAIGSEKWRGSALAQQLQGKIKLVFEENLGLVDFHLPNRICILYVSETDLVSGNGFKRRLVRFRNASNLHGIVITEKTRLSEQYFPPIQKFIVLELGMTLLPVASQSETSQLIIQLEDNWRIERQPQRDWEAIRQFLQKEIEYPQVQECVSTRKNNEVREQSKEHESNPFFHRKRPHLMETSVLQTVQQIPGVGKVKALQLLQQFPNINKLSNASIQQLELVVGRVLAQQIYTFLTQTK